MSGRVHRDFRKQANEVARQTSETLSEPIMAALQNEARTRERVDALEEWKADAEFSRQAMIRWRGRNLWGRFKWLFTGR